jgi:hypothetical protein
MNPGNRIPMTKAELVKLQPGDQVVVYWAKDDNPEYVRCDFETQTVLQYNPERQELVVEEGYEWYLNRMEDDDTSENTSRGYAYFFRP